MPIVRTTGGAFYIKHDPETLADLNVGKRTEIPGVISASFQLIREVQVIDTVVVPGFSRIFGKLVCTGIQAPLQLFDLTRYNDVGGLQRYSVYARFTDEEGKKLLVFVDVMTGVAPGFGQSGGSYSTYENLVDRGNIQPQVVAFQCRHNGALPIRTDGVFVIPDPD